MRRRGVVALITAALVALVVGGAVMAFAPDGPSGACAPTLVPAYAGAGEVEALARREHPPALVIVNPDSGVGARREEAYVDAVRRAQAAGSTVIGYVAAGYGRRDVAAVVAEAERYRDWYGVDGIFLDETSHHAADLPHYRQLTERLRSWSDPLVLNPGVVPARGYFALADVVVTFEGPFAAYREALEREPAWVRERPASTIAHLVYAASPDEARAAAALRPHARYIYLTPGVLPDPWGSVAGYAPAGRHARPCA